MALEPTVQWNEVTTNADDTPCIDLAGYRVYYGTVSLGQTLYVEVAVPGPLWFKFTTGLTKYVPNYFRVTAFDNVGNEGAPSAEVSTLVSGGLILKF